MYNKSFVLEETKPLYTIVSELTEYFQLQLHLADTSVHDYVTKRGFTSETLQRFRIGYCPHAQAVVDFASTKNGWINALEKIGFWKIIDDNIHVKFAERLMFPFSDIDNSVYGFSGRILTDTVSSDKYINTNNCAVFNKSVVVYGLREALQKTSNIPYWIIVEGNADVVSLSQAGFHNVVAGAGTSITKQQLLRLGSYSKDFKILMDSDDPGRKAAYSLQDILQELHFTSKVCMLDGVKDADEAIRLGKQEIITEALK